MLVVGRFYGCCCSDVLAPEELLRDYEDLPMLNLPLSCFCLIATVCSLMIRRCFSTVSMKLVFTLFAY
jgi:hypothetical protein